MFKRFIDDGFGVTKGSKTDFEYWVSKFNMLRETITIDKFKYGDEVDFMDLFIFKGEKFKYEGIFDVSIFQKSENKYMYIPAKSGHAKHTIKNFIRGELKRYVRCNSIKSNYLKIRNNFFCRLRKRGYKKVPLRRLFSSVKFESRNILLAISTENLDFCEIRDSEVDVGIVKDAERIFTDTFSEKTDVLEEKNQNNIHCISVNIPVNCVSPAKVGCFIQFVIKICYKKNIFVLFL